MSETGCAVEVHDSQEPIKNQGMEQEVVERTRGASMQDIQPKTVGYRGTAAYQL